MIGSRPDRFDVVGLAASGGNIDLLAGQVAQQLGELAARPRISPAMRALFMRLAGEWVLLAPAAEATPAQPAGGAGRHSPAGVQ